MFMRIMLASIVSLMLVSGAASAAPPVQNSYHVDIGTDISGGLDSGLQKFTASTTQVNFQNCTPGCEQFSLGAFWQTADYDTGTGSECFPIGGGLGSIQVSKSRKNPLAGAAVFWFKSTHTITKEEIKYQLTITGGWEGVFPPPQYGNIATMTATAWKMQTEGKGQHRRNACKGEGGGPITVVLLVTNTTP